VKKISTDLEQNVWNLLLLFSVQPQDMVRKLNRWKKSRTHCCYTGQIHKIHQHFTHALQFGLVIFWQKKIGAKAAHKMLMKLTNGFR